MRPAGLFRRIRDLADKLTRGEVVEMDAIIDC